MKLQGIARIITKNLTVVSIASAFLLGVLGMTDLKDKIFDTSTWFMSPAEVEEKFGEDEDELINATEPDQNQGTSDSENQAGEDICHEQFRIDFPYRDYGHRGKHDFGKF